MKLLSTLKNGKLTLFLSGELDHHAARGVVSNIEEMIDDYFPRDCVIDMSDLSFMDSSGIAVILKTYKRMNELGGRTWLEGVNSQPLRVIDASGIDRMVPITRKEERG